MGLCWFDEWGQIKRLSFDKDSHFGDVERVGEAMDIGTMCLATRITLISHEVTNVVCIDKGRVLVKVSIYEHGRDVGCYVILSRIA